MTHEERAETVIVSMGESPLVLPEGETFRGWLRAKIVGAIAAAVAEERKACELIAAERWVVGRHQVAYDIADAISRRTD